METETDVFSGWHPAVFSGREKRSKDQELHRKFQVRPGYMRSCLIFFFKYSYKTKKMEASQISTIRQMDK